MRTEPQMLTRLRQEYVRASAAGGHFHGIRCVQIVADAARNFRVGLAPHPLTGKVDEERLAADLAAIDAACKAVVAEASAENARMAVA